MERSACFICPALRKLAPTVLKQFSKQDFMPPCSIKEIVQTAPKHFRHIHSPLDRFWRSAVKAVKMLYYLYLFYPTADTKCAYQSGVVVAFYPTVDIKSTYQSGNEVLFYPTADINSAYQSESPPRIYLTADIKSVYRSESSLRIYPIADVKSAYQSENTLIVSESWNKKHFLTELNDFQSVVFVKCRPCQPPCCELSKAFCVFC